MDAGASHEDALSALIAAATPADGSAPPPPNSAAGAAARSSAHRSGAASDSPARAPAAPSPKPSPRETVATWPVVRPPAAARASAGDRQPADHRASVPAATTRSGRAVKAKRRTDSPSPPPVRASPGQRGGNATPNRSDGAGGDWDGVSPDGAIKKGTWAPAEDALLRNLVDEHGARRYAPARAPARPPAADDPQHVPHAARGPRKIARRRGVRDAPLPPAPPSPRPSSPTASPHPAASPRSAGR